MITEEKKQAKRWTEEDEKKLRGMLQTHLLKEIALSLGRTERAVRLHLHRERIAVNPRVGKNMLLELLNLCIVNPELFMPNRKFYSDVRINQNRWWRLYRGDEKLTEDEYARLSEYFRINPEHAFEKRQMEIAFL